MGWFSDALDFELFHTKDILKKVGDDPERLFIGAIEPASTELWNGVLGTDYEPLVDQLGGAYGGDWISTGNPQGGVYKRAQDAGINTESGAFMQDAAHVIAANYATSGVSNIGGGSMAGSGSASSGAGGGSWFDWAQLAAQAGSSAGGKGGSQTQVPAMSAGAAGQVGSGPLNVRPSTPTPMSTQSVGEVIVEPPPMNANDEDKDDKKNKKDSKGQTKEVLKNVFELMKEPMIQEMLGFGQQGTRAQSAAPIAGGGPGGQVMPGMGLPGGAGMNIGQLLASLPRAR